MAEPGETYLCRVKILVAEGTSVPMQMLYNFGIRCDSHLLTGCSDIPGCLYDPLPTFMVRIQSISKPLEDGQIRRCGPDGFSVHCGKGALLSHRLGGGNSGLTFLCLTFH